MFCLFSPCVINLSRNKNICSGWKKCSALIGWFAWFGYNMAAFAAWQVVSSMKNEQQSQNLLLKVDQCSTFHNNFFQPATKVFVAGQVDGARWKTGNIDENLQRNDVTRQVEGFCISYLAALKRVLSMENSYSLSSSYCNLKVATNWKEGMAFASELNFFLIMHERIGRTLGIIEWLT